MEALFALICVSSYMSYKLVFAQVLLITTVHLSESKSNNSAQQSKNAVCAF